MIRLSTNKFLFGLDISLSCTGVAIYDLEQRAFVFIGSFNTEKIKSKKNRYHNALKLKALGDWMQTLIEQYPPFYIAIERGFSQFNTATQVLFRAHGVVNYLFQDYPQTYYPPKSVKEALVHGNATKEDLTNTIKIKYNGIEFSNEDESDAFAIAVCALVDHELMTWEKPDFAYIVSLRIPKEEKPKKPKKPAAPKKPRKKKGAS